MDIPKNLPPHEGNQVNHKPKASVSRNLLEGADLVGIVRERGLKQVRGGQHEYSGYFKNATARRKEPGKVDVIARNQVTRLGRHLPTK